MYAQLQKIKNNKINLISKHVFYTTFGLVLPSKNDLLRNWIIFNYKNLCFQKKYIYILQI